MCRLTYVSGTVFIHTKALYVKAQGIRMGEREARIKRIPGGVQTAIECLSDERVKTWP